MIFTQYERYGIQLFMIFVVGNGTLCWQELGLMSFISAHLAWQVLTA